MRGKRSKQYRKLMQQYGLNFGFREPYQVLLDADMIRDADRFKMDLVGGLERTLHGTVKPMITQCSMRHLYASASDPGVSFLIEKAKLYERRRCDHRPEEYPDPLSAVECLSSVVDPKGSKTNKHRYVVASQQLDVRKAMREVTGVPLVYINRSVMIMEPMAGATAHNREREERQKFRAGLKGRKSSGSGNESQGTKRKRDNGDMEPHAASQGDLGKGEASPKQKKRHEKGPNPLAVKKSKKRVNSDGMRVGASPKPETKIGSIAEAEGTQESGSLEGSVKRKRRRKHKSGSGEEHAAETEREVRDGDEGEE